MENKYKQFIVAGAPTGGKTTFANELLKKYHVQHVCIDPIIEAFEDVFPELGITHDADTHEKHLIVCQKFKPFVSRMIDGMDVDSFVVEGFRLPIRDLKLRYPGLQFFVFGYPNSTPQEKLEQIRKHDNGRGNWVDELSDQELLETFRFLIEESKLMKKECDELDIPFFDTGKDFHETIKKALEVVK